MSGRDRLLEALAIVGAFVELSDRVQVFQSQRQQIAAQGALLALHNSIQKNRPRIVKWSDEIRTEYAAKEPA